MSVAPKTSNEPDVCALIETINVALAESMRLGARQSMKLIELTKAGQAALATLTMQLGWDGERCRDCKRPYALVWHAPDDLWKRIWGNDGGLLCPDCFAARCEIEGIYVQFRAEPVS